ncbi:MAG: hypothetical protein KKF56_03515 [Nanoarchaeota archaeon]|nr:hypothetical protein [Nanoarchaeota archaeon]
MNKKYFLWIALIVVVALIILINLSVDSVDEDSKLSGQVSADLELDDETSYGLFEYVLFGVVGLVVLVFIGIYFYVIN